jgi:ABC-2 type transport system ATP-binding protein
MPKKEETMSEPILVAQDLKKSFGEIEAVKGISLQVARGEVFGLLGPNGAGKTTTISMLTALLEPTGGQITVDGLDLKSHTNEVKAKMGLVPQEMALYMTLSARQNLMFFGRIYGLKGKELRQRVDEVLEMIGLTERADDAVDKYSGGMKRRVNIGAGLLHKPQILFLDEPTVGVDPQSRNAIFENVEALNRAGMSVIYTTHYMEEAQRLCHRVAIVDEGKLIALDTPTALIRSLGGGVVMLGVAEGAPDDLPERIAQLPAVKSATRSDGQLKIETQRFQEALMGTLDVTNQIDVRITSLEILEPNLESVFLHLTGKKLRQ